MNKHSPYLPKKLNCYKYLVTREGQGLIARFVTRKAAQDFIDLLNETKSYAYNLQITHLAFDALNEDNDEHDQPSTCHYSFLKRSKKLKGIIEYIYLVIIQKRPLAFCE